MEATASKATELTVEYPPREMGHTRHDSVWHHIADPVRKLINENTSTLVFVNSRRLAETMTNIINQDGERIAYAHHGSLSRELRSVVETRLKAGDLSAIVATTSLEMGIDIGKLDKVILIQTPFSVSAAVQRIGRSGHSVHQTSSGSLFPSHGMDLIHGAVMARLVARKDVEPIRPVRCPLDVLSQVLVSMLGIQPWDLDQLFSFIRCTWAFHDLRETDYRSALNMLAGRYRETRIRELQPRILIDEVSNTAKGRPGALLLIYSSGGTIPDRGYFSMRVQGSRARVGELDEEFVWERKPQDTFSLGTQSWKIVKIDHQAVEVVPWRGHVKIQPFWKAETVNRDSHYSRKVLEFLEMCSDHKDDPELQSDLVDGYSLSEVAAAALIRYLKRQRGSTGAEVPHRHHLLIEHSADPSTAGEFEKIFIHTLWGNRINYPLSLILAGLFERDRFPVEVMSDNELIMLQVPAGARGDGVVVADILAAIDPAENDALIRGQLERGGFFGARFRENAGRALLLPRGGAGKRIPLWVNRLKAKNLMEAVSGYQDFPIILETWRSCIQDEFELDQLKLLLEEVATENIRISEVNTKAPSPFAEGSIWQSTNNHLYGDDTPRVGGGHPLVEESVLKQAVFSDTLRPELEPVAVNEFCRKVQRTEEGYAPRPGDELIEWVGERLAIPIPEWEELIDACVRDHGAAKSDILLGVADRCVGLRLPGAETVAVVSVSGLKVLHEALELDFGKLEFLPLIEGQNLEEMASMAASLIAAHAAGDEPAPMPVETYIGQWLSYYGPVSQALPAGVLGIPATDSEDILSHLVDSKDAVRGRLTKGAIVDEICDAGNLERLLAFTRRRNREGTEVLPVELLPSLVAQWQRVGFMGTCQDDIKKVLDPLFGFGARAGQWEEDFLPARLHGYQKHWLDELLNFTDLEWGGCGAGRISFCFPGDLELFAEERQGLEQENAVVSRLFPDRIGRYSFWDLRDRSGMKSGDFSEVLLDLVWSGRVRCDSYGVIRNGVLRGFKIASADEPARSRSRRRPPLMSQWKMSRPIAGNWFLTPGGSDGDLLDRFELEKDRIRVLLQRYPVIFRELLAHEGRPLAWSALFRTMRLMELSGEIVGGHFFSRIAGLQFTTPAALRALESGINEDSIYWMNAADPASLCGVDVAALKELLPERLPSTYLVFHGRKLVIVARKKGIDLEIRVDPGSPEIPDYLGALKSLTTRSFNPLKSIKVRTINGEAAGDSVYGPVLEMSGFIKDYQGYSLWAI